MKKFVFYLLITMFISLLLLYVYVKKNDHCSFIFKNNASKVVEWNGVNINLPQDYSFWFVNDGETLQVFNCKTFRDKEVFLNIILDKPTGQTIYEKLDTIKSLKNATVYDYTELNFAGQKSFMFNLKRDELEYRLIYVLSKNILIAFTSNDRRNFSELEPVLERIRFVDDEKADRK